MTELRQAVPHPTSRPSRRVPAAGAALWALLASFLPRVAGPVFTIILRRALGPSVAGLFDLSMVPYRFLDSGRNFGAGPALVYEPNVDRVTADTACTLNLLFALAATAIAQILARPIALYYGHPHVEAIIRWLSIAYVFTAAGSTHSYLLLRARNYRARAIPAVGQVIIAGDIAVVFAVWGFGVGALIVRELSSAALGALLLWLIAPYRPMLRLDLAVARRLLRYGAWLGAGLTLLFASQNVDVFIGGRIIHNPAQMGFYTTAWSLAFTLPGVIALVTQSTVFPALSRLQHDLGLLRLELLRSVRQVALVMFPAGALLGSVAPVIIVPLLGHRWGPYRQYFPILTLLAVYAANRTTLSVFFEAYKAVGRPSLIWWYNAGKLAIMIPAVVIAAQHGPIGLALMYVPLQLVEIPASLLLARGVLHISPRDVLAAVALPLGAAALMSAAVIGTELIGLRLLHADDGPILVTAIVVGVVTYSGALRMVAPNLLGESREILLRGF